jgi:D-sedoheptulose 7-phosphate isomerase
MAGSDYSKYLVQLLDQNDFQLDEIVNEFMSCFERGNSIWIMGNGGSASTAEHFETDLSFVRLGDSVQNLRVSALTANSALITAIANDIGFEFIFSHQLIRKSSPGDICLVISASGNSSNLLRAISTAKEQNLITVGILGFDGGQIADLVDFSIIVTTEIGKYGPVEDIHLSICHELAAIIGSRLLGRDVK